MLPASGRRRSVGPLSQHPGLSDVVVTGAATDIVFELVADHVIVLFHAVAFEEQKYDAGAPSLLKRFSLLRSGNEISSLLPGF